MELDFFQLFRFSEIILKFAQKYCSPYLAERCLSVPFYICPFYLNWNLITWKNCTWKRLEQFTLTLLSYAWFCSQGHGMFTGQQSCTRVSPEVRPYITPFIFLQMVCCFPEVAATTLKTSISGIFFWNRHPFSKSNYTIPAGSFSTPATFGGLGVFVWLVGFCLILY